MYDYINGTLTYKSSGAKGFCATIENCGVGYRIEIMQRDYQNLPSENSELKIFLVLIHKEDSMHFCGFLKREDRDMFNVLTSVSGVGSKMAINLLNSFNVKNFVNFVLDNNYKALTAAKGVGPKLAQKIILELKDKLNSYKTEISEQVKEDINISHNAEDARLVLISLGYENSEIKSALENAITNLPQSASSEEILKNSLQYLSI